MVIGIGSDVLEQWQHRRQTVRLRARCTGRSTCRRSARNRTGAGNWRADPARTFQARTPVTIASNRDRSPVARSAAESRSTFAPDLPERLGDFVAGAHHVSDVLRQHLNIGADQFRLGGRKQRLRGNVRIGDQFGSRGDLAFADGGDGAQLALGIGRRAESRRRWPWSADPPRQVRSVARRARRAIRRELRGAPRPKLAAFAARELRRGANSSSGNTIACSAKLNPTGGTTGERTRQSRHKCDRCNDRSTGPRQARSRSLRCCTRKCASSTGGFSGSPIMRGSGTEYSHPSFGFAASTAANKAAVSGHVTGIEYRLGWFIEQDGGAMCPPRRARPCR